MTTRDEARKMAERVTHHPEDGSWCMNPEEAFMACYDAMTKGEPDGWCAWHPVNGWDGLTFDELERESEKLSLGNDCDSPDWQVVPVKLIKMEGASK